MAKISREEYADVYGPTIGDEVRLGDTDIWISPEKDYTFGGDEAQFGGGKTIRESQLQSTQTSSIEGALDLVITNVLVLDHWGVVRADLGIKDGRIVGLGKAGNPDVMDEVDEELIIGPATEVIAGEGKIVTAGAVDTHVHFLCTDAMWEALAAGTTTLVGGGTGPTEGSRATTITPGPSNLGVMHRALDELPINFLLFGKGNTVASGAFAEEAYAGAGGWKVHEDWGSTPAAVDAALKAADKWGLQVALHADSLNETGYMQDTLRAIDGRGIHIFHAEGAGGGHAPDILATANHANVLAASTNPTLPYGINTVDEHLDMLMICHHLNPAIPEDLAFAESRIRANTMMAEDILQDMGAMSITSSDAQAMGRIGEVIIRTWQVAHMMKQYRGRLPSDLPADNERARRYVAKYTICPSIAQGIDHVVGSIEPGKMADLVIWDTPFFGVRPSLVVKNGTIVMGQLGDPNAAIPTPQPVWMRKAMGGSASSAPRLATSFVSPAALDAGLQDRLGLQRKLTGIRPTRDVSKADMPNNTAMPKIEIDPETFQTIIDDKRVVPEAAGEVPLAQRYQMF